MTTQDIRIETIAEDEPLGVLVEALFQNRDDALAARFVVSGDVPDPTVGEAFRDFLEATEIRSGLLVEMLVLDDRQRAHLIAKDRIYSTADIAFEAVRPSELREDLLALVAGPSGRGRPAGGAVDAFLRPGNGDTTRRFFRSRSRWAFWLFHPVQYTMVAVDDAARAVEMLIVGYRDSAPARPPQPPAAPPSAVASVAPISGTAVVVEALDDVPAHLSVWKASMDVSTPGSRTGIVRVRVPALVGAPEEVAARVEEGGLLPLLLGHPLVGGRLGHASGEPVAAAFRRGSFDCHIWSLTMLMAEGGTFADVAIEPPDEVERTIAGVTAELSGGEATRVLVWTTSDVWSPWYVGLIRGTSLYLDTASGTLTTIVICEWD